MSELATAARPAARQSRTLQIPSLLRLAPIRSANRDKRTLELVWSTGAQVRRYDWWEDEFWIEELDLSRASLARMNNGAPLLNSHARWDLRDVIGVVERAWIDGDEGRCEVRFSNREDVRPIAEDAYDGILRNVSIGYEVHEFEERGFDPETGYRIMRAVDWTPFEVSLVPVGADDRAGTRSRDDGAAERPRHACAVRFHQPAAEAARTQEVDMTQAAAAASEAEKAAEKARIETVRNEAQENERARVRDILAVGEQFGYQDLARTFVAEGKSEREFRDAVLEEIRKKHTGAVSAGERDIGMTGQELRRYSLTKAIRALVENNWKDAGFERECSEAAARRDGLAPAHGGFKVPWEVQSRLLMPADLGRMMAQGGPGAVEAFVRAMMSRDLSAATDSAGGFLVATNNLAGSFIEMLRASTVVASLGATTLPGLRDDVTIPKQSGAATAYWLANETTAITESQQTFGQVALTPRNVGAYTEVSRQLLMQSSPAADMIVMEDLRRQLALAIDVAALNGSGASGQPTGILNTGGIGSVTGTSIAYAGVLEFQTDVATANALEEGCAYVTTPAIAALLAQRVKFTSTASPLWDGNLLNGSISGFRARATTQMPAATMLFGAFRQVILAEWGALEIALNPYANFPAAISGIRGIVSVDIGVRQAGAFSAASSIT